MLIFAAPIFTGKLTDPRSLLDSILAFFAISFLASATYVANDLLDQERDANHPVKKNRPLASGLISPSSAVVLAIVLTGLGFGLGFKLGTGFCALLAYYLVQQVAYNLKLKHVPIADVFVIALGFIVRAMLGAVALHVQISGWLLFCTGALALMLGFGKRRHEFVLQGEGRGGSREVLERYSLPVLDGLLLVSAAGAAQSYGTYSLISKTAQHHPGLMFTSLFVLYGIFRYLYVIYQKGEGGEPETVLFKDPHLLFSVIGFLLTALLAVANVLNFGFIEGLG